MNTDNTLHYNKKPRRRAEFFMPVNQLKNKVGTGGLSEDVLRKAQDLLDNNNVDFVPLATTYLNSLGNALTQAQTSLEDRDHAKHENLIYILLYPSLQLKANGGMFGYPLISDIAQRLIHFLEVIERIDADAIEVVTAFRTAMLAVISGTLDRRGNAHGHTLVKELDEACFRYFDRYPDNCTDPDHLR